jgi:hypothetical protein
MPRKPKLTLVHPADIKAAREANRNRPYAQETGTPIDYNPDGWPKEFGDMSEKTITQEEFRRRMMIPLKAFQEGKIQVRGRIAVVQRVHKGHMVEAERSNDGKAWRLKQSTSESTVHGLTDGFTVEVRHIRSQEQAKNLFASPEWATAKILESWDSFDFGGEWYGDGYAGPPNNEYIPLLGGPFSKNLYLNDYLDMQAKCFWVKNHHPLGKAAITMLRNYTIGKGVDVLAASPECQKLWDAFVERCKYNAKLRDDVTTLIWGGETMTLKGRDAMKLAKITPVDPSTVWEIVTDPVDIDNVLYYHQQYPTQWQLVYKSSDIPTEYVINDIPAEQIIHIKENVTPGEKRGRSDLFPVLSWLKRYRDWTNAKSIKAQIEESYGLDITVDGSLADVQDIASQNTGTRIPKAGTVYVHNKQVERKYLQPTSSSNSSRDDLGELLRKDIAVGMGIAPEWLGETGQGSSRANSLVKEAPATRTIEDKQLKVEAMVREIYDYVIQVDGSMQGLPDTQVRKASLGTIKLALAQRDFKQAMTEIASMLTMKDVSEPLDKSMEVIFPEISKEDRTGKIVDVLKGEIAGFITHERASTMYAKEMAINNYDYDDEMKAKQAENDSGRGAEWQQDAIQASSVKAGGGAGQPGGSPKSGSDQANAGLRQGDGK